jgi:hypothetical protein
MNFFIFDSRVLTVFGFILQYAIHGSSLGYLVKLVFFFFFVQTVGMAMLKIKRLCCMYVLNRESLYEDEEFDQHQRQLAALLVSKVLLFC